MDLISTWVFTSISALYSIILRVEVVLVITNSFLRDFVSIVAIIYFYF